MEVQLDLINKHHKDDPLLMEKYYFALDSYNLNFKDAKGKITDYKTYEQWTHKRYEQNWVKKFCQKRAHYKYMNMKSVGLQAAEY